VTTAFKTHNVRIQTPDNETLGAWFTFADAFYSTHKTHFLNGQTTNTSSPTSATLSRDYYIRAALRAHPTILFLHGTTGTRVVRIRVQQYQAFATRLQANVLAPDYRGFADSTGKPSEAGLTIDTRAAWDWLRTHGASPDSVLVVGSSLGTGVAVQFAHALEEEAVLVEAEAPRVVNSSYVPSRAHVRVGGENGNRTRGCGVSVRERPRGVVLLSPFSKLETLLDTYYILGLMPLFAPLRAMPYLSSKSSISHRGLRKGSHERKKGTEVFWVCGETGLVKKCIIHRFDSLAKVVVSAVFQGSVDVFQKRIFIVPAACPSPIWIDRGYLGR
jgi:abhydrolase domain-containing protein 12